MRFSLILATRDRMDMFVNMLHSIRETTEHKDQIEVIAVVDDDDETMKESAVGLMTAFREINLMIVSRERSEWMNRDYINYAYKISVGDHALVLNDDTIFTGKNWDSLAWDTIRNYLSDKPDGIFLGFTENFNNSPGLCYFPIISRKAVEAAGFFMPDNRKSWGADVDVCQLYSSVNRVLQLPCVEIRHVNFRQNSAPRDHISLRMENIFRENSGHFDLGFHSTKLSGKISNYKKFKKSKVLVVYNICGINNNEKVSNYCACIKSVLNQRFENFDVVVSGCMTSAKTKEILEGKFRQRVSFNWTDEILPVNVTMNHSVKKFVKNYGKCDGYVYVDSGVTMENDQMVIDKLYHLMAEGCGIVVGGVDTDTGYENFGVVLDQTSHYYMKPGQTCNMHCMMFNHAILERYGAILPDIFSSDTSESTFFYLCSAINLKYAIHKDVLLHHQAAMDGASSGFHNKRPFLFGTTKDINTISADGQKYGFGYEECTTAYKGIVTRKHDPSKYKNGRCTDPRLASFIRDNVFLKPEEFDYDKIVGHFVGNDMKSKYVFM